MAGLNLRDFLAHFGTTELCLDYLRRKRWPEGITCRKCERVTGHHMMVERKCYTCQECGTQVHPTAGTFLHKSRVPLPDWFFVIWQFSKTRAGFSAKQVEREIGVSYPTALRMCNLIREALGEPLPAKLSGTVEVDETYMGNSRRYFQRKRKPGRGAGKPPVFGVVERGGRIVAVAVPNVKRETVFPLIKRHVEEGTEIHSDEYAVYIPLAKEGYRHARVRHKGREYVRYREGAEPVHTNTLEGFWSYPKNAIQGIHRGVSAHKLQGYVNEHVFRYNRRKDGGAIFDAMLSRVCAPSSPALAA